MSTASYRKKFRENPSVNPETGRSIVVGGETYNKLVDKYGSSRKSPVRKSPVRKSPARSPRKSPMRVSVRESVMMKDPFEVLSEESILKVLNKLNENHRLAWVNSSPKVRRVYEMNF